MNPARFATATLQRISQGNAVMQILAAALAAVDPAAAVRHTLAFADDQLLIDAEPYALNGGRLLLVAVGKAALPMAAAAAAVLGPALTSGVVVVKHADPAITLPPALTVLEGGHPMPDARSVAAAERVMQLLSGITERDLVLLLVSGGGSALLTLPAPGLTLADLQALTAELLACGASINEINCLRKHLDLVKGGGLALAAAPARVVTLILSDVVGNPLDVIASGPTVADSSTFPEALAVLARYGISERVPMCIRERLHQGAAGVLPETPKPGDARLAGVRNRIIGSNRVAAAAARSVAQANGFHTHILSTWVQGEAREFGRFLAALARELDSSGDPLPRPACLILGGETTVTLRGNGLGGRNQEAALACVADLSGLRDVLVITLATDGGDGPTDAAGAVVSGDTLAQANAAGLDPAAFLARNDAYRFFDALGDLLRPGPTHTNVNDLAFVVAF